ncbi:hypothetical protein [Tenacibaculum phage JQ]|nr:hypothetical protein [Tenacibaculum phage JQ]
MKKSEKLKQIKRHVRWTNKINSKYPDILLSLQKDWYIKMNELKQELN